MNLKLACADFTFPLLPHDNVLDVIAILGFQGVDIGLFAGRSHIQPDDVIKNIRASAQELSAKMSDRGLEFADIYLQASSNFKELAVNHPNPPNRRKSRDIFQRILEFTARCNATHMSGLPGVVWEEESYEASLKRCSEELAWRLEQARQVEVTFSVEAHIGSIVPSPQEAINLVKMTPGLTLTLDYGHFVAVGIPDSEIEPMMEYASHFHARCGCKGRLQAPFKENTVDFPQVMQAMKRTNYSGWIGVEYVWVDWERCNEVDNISETILLRDHIKSVKL